jgi:8-oxo-dGTP pyrophosphatase MutT (NUDIX family)
MNHPEVAIIIIRDTHGDFFMHRRNKEKERFPSKYGLGAGGRLNEGENPLDGARRELVEEAGLKSMVKFLFSHLYSDAEATYQLHVHETTVERQHIPNDDSEWDWSGWLEEGTVTKLARKRL